MELTEIINASLTEIDFDAITTVESKSCRSFNELMEVYKRDLTITQSIEDCVAVSCAIHVATHLEGDPLWIYLVGAPSSGKSTICELICADEYHTKPLSKFTGMISGSRPKEGEEPYHLANQLNAKCVVVKDGTMMLEGPPADLARIFGELRDIYDGSLEATYRNGVEASLSGISFGLIIGITERIYGLNMSALGERFLHIRLENSRAIELVRNKSAIESIFGSTRKITGGDGAEDERQFPVQRQYTAGFLQHLYDTVHFHELVRPSWTEEDAVTIQNLADVIIASRATVPLDSSNNIAYDSQPEASTRVVKQLSRLALALCVVYNYNELNDHIKRVLHKVALDTAHSRQHEIIKALSASPEGLTRSGISTATNVGIEQIRSVIDTLLSLGICEQTHTTRATVVGLPDTTTSVVTVQPWIREAFNGTFNAEAQS